MLHNEHMLTLADNKTQISAQCLLYRIFIPAQILSNDFQFWLEKLHNEELHNLYCSPNINLMTEAKRPLLTGYPIFFRYV
jgi:hypothetical protein